MCMHMHMHTRTYTWSPPTHRCLCSPYPLPSFMLSFRKTKMEPFGASYLFFPSQKQAALARCSSSYPLPETSHSGSETCKHMSNKSDINTICKQILLCEWQVQNPASGTTKHHHPSPLENSKEEQLQQVRVAPDKMHLCLFCILNRLRDSCGVWGFSNLMNHCWISQDLQPSSNPRDNFLRLSWTYKPLWFPRTIQCERKKLCLMWELHWIWTERQTNKEKKKRLAWVYGLCIHGISTDKQTYSCWHESQKPQWLASLPRNGLHQ